MTHHRAGDKQERGEVTPRRNESKDQSRAKFQCGEESHNWGVGDDPITRGQTVHRPERLDRAIAQVRADAETKAGAPLPALLTAQFRRTLTTPGSARFSTAITAENYTTSVALPDGVAQGC